jgi:hypothetical protein
MKETSEFYRPSPKEVDIYRLLLSFGGKARWKQLKGKIKGCRGPTTLKKTLDQMISKRKIRKEAVAGAKGPEVWYSLTQEGKRDIVNSIVGDHTQTIKVLKEVFATMDPVVALVLLGELRKSVNELVRYVEDPYSHLPKNAELISSSETEGEKTQKEDRKGGENE